MDAFELVRARAQTLHDTVVSAAGDTPLDGWEIACRAAEAAGCAVIARHTDDALLHGAEAVLDRGLEAIFHRDTDRATAAALVAHELGHLDLHPGSAACPEIDPGAPEDPSPSAGTERVDGYGAHERDELQANVYARELLLPRVEARRLFLEEQQTATHIAHHRTLPLELVRQQLCDALLIPAREPSTPGQTPEPSPPGPLSQRARGSQTLKRPGSSSGGPATHPAPESLPNPKGAKRSGPPGRDASRDLPTTNPDALRLDPSQAQAAHHRGSPLLLEAGPGTGKTRTLVARIVHLIENGAPPESILALTFSNKAAGEIVERVATHLPEAAPRIWTGTFHAFGLDLLRRYHALLGLDPEVRVVDRADAIELLEERLPTLGLVHHQNLYDPALELKEILAAISRAKDEMVDADAYTELAQALHDRTLADDALAEDDSARKAAEKALEVARVYAVYSETLRRAKVVDFGDLVALAARLLESRPAVRQAVRRRHRHILVDEYQDVNRASARLVKALAGAGEFLWVVGDARQSIYRFRGASSANLGLFTSDFPNSTRLSLATNYRSHSEIVATYSAFAHDMLASADALDLDLEPHRGPGGEVWRAVLDDGEGEIGAVAARALELCGTGTAFGEQAVLCRSGSLLERVAEGLEARGVPVLHLGSLFERDEVRDLLALLTLIVDPGGGGLLRLAALPEYGVPLADVRRFLTATRERGRPVLGELRRLAGLEPDADADKTDTDKTEDPPPEPELSPKGRAGLERLAHDLAGFEPVWTPWQILTTYLFDRGVERLREAHGGGTAESLRRIAIYQLLSFVRSAQPRGRGFPARRLLERVRRLVLLGEERDLRQIPAPALHLDAVRLLTIHAAKGLEFSAVHLPGLRVGSLPASFRAPRCPPPPGLVETVDNRPESAEESAEEPAAEPTTRLTAAEVTSALREGHAEEEECLFFVATSRARDRLALYRSARAGAMKRRPSPFLERLAAPGAPAPPEESAPGVLERVRQRAEPRVPMLGELAALGGSELTLYENCPRRFFYSRVIGLTGAKRDGAFVRAHRCLHDVVEWLAERAAAGEAPLGKDLRAELGERLDTVWSERGPTEHAFASEYRHLANRVVGHLADLHAGLELEPATRLELELGGSVLALVPQIQAVRDGGTRLVRLVRTGRRGSFKGDDTIHGLYHEAVQRQWGTAAEVEVVHLSDGERTLVEMTERKLSNRLKKGATFMADLASGRFPPKRDAVRCPRCPYFFVCPALPDGAIEWPGS